MAGSWKKFTFGGTSNTYSELEDCFISCADDVTSLASPTSKDLMLQHYMTLCSKQRAEMTTCLCRLEQIVGKDHLMSALLEEEPLVLTLDYYNNPVHKVRTKLNFLSHPRMNGEGSSARFPTRAPDASPGSSRVYPLNLTDDDC